MFRSQPQKVTDQNNLLLHHTVCGGLAAAGICYFPVR